MGTALKKSRKTKLRIICWLFGCIAALLVILVLLILHKPAGYYPPKVVADNEISSYLTHQLLPQLYNGAQRQQPFVLEVTEEGINDIIAHSHWPRQAGGCSFLTPAFSFHSGKVVVMGSAVLKDVEFAVSVELEPAVGSDGLLDLSISGVRVGAVNITALAKTIAAGMYRNKVASGSVDANALGAKVLAALLIDEPFEPVFEVDDEEIRAEKISVSGKKLTFFFVPAQKPAP